MLHFSSAFVKTAPYALYITDAPAMHSHGYWEIAIFLKGLSYNHTPDEKIQCPPGTCMIFRPSKDFHYITHEAGLIGGHLDVYISERKMHSICHSLNSKNESSLYDLLLQGEKTPTFFLSSNAITYITTVKIRIF